MEHDSRQMFLGSDQCHATVPSNASQLVTADRPRYFRIKGLMPGLRFVIIHLVLTHTLDLGI